MSSRLKEPRLPLSLGQRPGLSHDTRKDLGYGISVDKFHTPREKAGSFPYPEEDDHEELDLEMDDSLLKKVSNKISTPYKSSDHLIGRSADHSARVNGNRPTAIGESVAKNSLVPFPGMYKNRVQVGGGVNSPTLISPGQYNRTGTYKGWSHAPIDLNDDAEYEEATSEDELVLKKVRKLVQNVLKNNDEET